MRERSVLRIDVGYHVTIQPVTAAMCGFCYVYQYATSMQRRCMTGGESVTITGMAKELNVSAMTIYRRMKRAGVDVAELRDDATGELTSEGVAIIGNLFSTTGTTTSTTGSATQPQPAPQPVAEVEAAVLRAKLDAAEDTVARLDAECERLRQQVDTLTAMLQAEQQQRQRLLMDGQQRRGGLFGWFRRPRDGDE